MLVLLGYIIIVISAIIYSFNEVNERLATIVLIAIVFSAWVVINEETKYGVTSVC